MNNSFDTSIVETRRISQVGYTNVLKVIVFILCLIILTSCHATIVKPQVDVRTNQLKFDSVALRVVAPDLKVKDITEFEQSYTYGLLPLSPLLGFMAAGIEHAINIAKDDAAAYKYKEDLTKEYVSKYLGESFIEHIRKSNIFPISFSDHGAYKELLHQGYDAIIILEIEEFSLTKELLYVDMLKVHLRVNATMANLISGDIIWTKNETITCDDAYTFEEYKANNSSVLIKGINASLDKMSFRLSGYIIYSE